MTIGFDDSFFCLTMAGVLESVREDDFVEYYLFPFETEDIINANEDKQEDVKVALSQVESIIRKYSQNYIWHKDSFRVGAPLSLSSEQNDRGMQFISSDSLITNFINV
jgi:hypothetical protein